MENAITPVHRLAGGAIDYGFYRAEAAPPEPPGMAAVLRRNQPSQGRAAECDERLAKRFGVRFGGFRSRPVVRRPPKNRNHHANSPGGDEP
jgi:hypothetical protein